jgi:hypothetical protein
MTYPFAQLDFSYNQSAQTRNDYENGLQINIESKKEKK